MSWSRMKFKPQFVSQHERKDLKMLINLKIYKPITADQTASADKEHVDLPESSRTATK